ncbi:MAG: 16S rRNA (cytosine(967)-C(5))-methyltransferase RsmB [Clostridia bacterium]|nr:16S rRNA (cytosine(967)-C(5))-methyltransferase RsmB [Clostridia bacterium]
MDKQKTHKLDKNIKKDVRKTHQGKTKTETDKRTDIPTVSAARMTALRSLYDVFFMDAYSNLSLDRQLRTARLSDEDRRLASSIFYTSLEKRSKTDYILAPFVKLKPDPIVECILHIAAAQILYMDRIPPHAAVNEAVNQAKVYKKDEAVGFVNGVLRSLLRAKEAHDLRLPSEIGDKAKYLETEYSASSFTVNCLIDAYGIDEAEKILATSGSEKSETLRPNLMKWTDADAESFLNDNNIEWEKGLSPHSYRIKHAGGITSKKEYEAGYFSVQGESAMLAAYACEPKRGMTMLDTCAAPGGKAALIAELMSSTGRVHAWDLHEHRVALMKANALRLGLDNMRCAVKDATVIKEDFVRGIDAVLIDAPCSGLGVSADKPEIRYRLTKEKLDSITETQKQLLNVCCEYVKAGGLLVYSTCTILPTENEDIVSGFLREHPEFRRETGTEYLPAILRPLCRDGEITLLQGRDAPEGFFIARMRRVF